MHVHDLAADLVAEQQDLDDVVSGLDGVGWMSATPSPRWTVADQVAHLTYFDEAAATAITDASTSARLTVVGTHGRSGLARLLLGSTSTAVLENATAVTVAVR